MSSWVWILLLVLAVGVVLVVAARRTATRSADVTDFTEVTISPELAELVRSTALSGSKLPAIKILRDETQMPLAAAKLVVERMVARHHRQALGGSPRPDDLA